jgi:hypothetical protein
MAPPAMVVEGEVIAAHSHWTDDRSRIVTDLTVQTDDGTVVVSQLGGSVDGIGMVTMPGPVILAPGMRVAVAAHRDVDLSHRAHIVLDSAKVLAVPPDYVRRGPTRAGRSLYWESGCVFVTVDAAGTAAISGDDELPVIDASIATWNDAGGPSCSYLKIMSDARATLEVGRDNVNLIKFRDTTWGRPAVGNDPPRAYPASAAGLTTLSYVDDGSSHDGAITDADIEINGVNFAISVNGLSTSTQPCRVELQNNLTHELGHLHGLEHTCLAAADPPRLDNLGNPVPTCDTTTDSKILDATMYNFQNCGETIKESLSQDDIQAKCEIYPFARAPGTCDRVVADGPMPTDDVFGLDTAGPSEGRGCCDASSGTRPGASLILAGLTIALLKRRRSTAR